MLANTNSEKFGKIIYDICTNGTNHTLRKRAHVKYNKFSAVKTDSFQFLFLLKL